jgi:hypothetical protein
MINKNNAIGLYVISLILLVNIMSSCARYDNKINLHIESENIQNIRNDIGIKLSKISNTKIRNIAEIEIEIENKRDVYVDIQNFILCVPLFKKRSMKDTLIVEDFHTFYENKSHKLWIVAKQNIRQYNFCTDSSAHRVVSLHIPPNTKVIERDMFVLEFPYYKNKNHKKLDDYILDDMLRDAEWED